MLTKVFDMLTDEMFDKLGFEKFLNQLDVEELKLIKKTILLI